MRVILSELSGANKLLYGEVEGPIKSVLMRRDEAWMHDEQNVQKKIFKKVPSTHRVEGYSAMAAFGDWEPVGENGGHPVNGTEALPPKFIPNETWKNAFYISRELLDDHVIGELKKRPEGFVDAYYRSKHRFFASLLKSALANKPELILKGFRFDTTCVDKKNLFSSQHPMLIKGGNQCNAFKDAFSYSALTKLQTEMQNLRDDNGNLLNLAPDTIIIPNIADLKEEVLGVLSANRDPATPGGNKGNVQAGMWNVLVWAELNDAVVGDNIPWMLFDSTYNQQNDCLIEQDRVDLEIKSSIAENDALKWTGYARFGGGFVDWRAIAAGGLSFGGNL